MFYFADDEKIYSVHNLATIKANGTRQSIRGTAEAPNPAEPGRLIVTFALGKYPSNPAEPGRLIVTFALVGTVFFSVRYVPFFSVL